MDFHTPKKEDCEGEWVNLTAWSTDHDQAVVAELDVDVEQTVAELQDDENVAQFMYTMDLEHDGPYDLLWFGKDEYGILPRPNWRPKVRRVEPDS